MADWHAGDVRFLAMTQLGERYRRYRLPDPDDEAAMAGSFRRYGQLTPLVVCLREETYEVLDGFKRLVAARKILDHPVCMAVTPAAVAAVRYAGISGKAMAARLARSGAQCAQVPRQIATREFIRRSHELGLHVHVWTLNTRQEIERALDLGADGVMTDDIVLLRDILIERGQWNPRVSV